MTRRLAAILAADIVGYTRLMQADEAGTIRAVNGFRADILDPALGGNSGRLAKSMGDGWLALFESPVEAVSAALQIQQALADRTGLSLRIGVHMGDVTTTDADIFGDSVNIAARLEAEAPSGGIALSDAVYSSLDGTLRPSFAEGGARRLKNIERPVQVWVRYPDKPSEAPKPLRTHAGRADLPRLTIRPVVCTDPRSDVLELASALTSDFGSFFRNVHWLRATVTSEATPQGYTVFATLRARGDRLRLEMKLQNSDGDEIWSRKFDGHQEDSFDWQDSTAMAATSDLLGVIFDAETLRLSGRDIADLSASELLLKGILTWSSASIETYPETMDYLARAIEVDPEFVEAYGEAIQVMNGAGTYGLEDELARFYEKLPGWVAKAVSFAGQSPILDVSVGIYTYGADGQADRLANTIDSVLRRAPFDGRVLTMAGWGNLWCGRTEAALECFLRGLQLSRNTPIYVAALGGAATASVQLGHDHDAIRYAEEGLVYSRAYPGFHSTRAAAHAMLGEPEKAQAALQELLAVEPFNTISRWRRYVNYGNSPGGERYFEGMRRAGLAE